MITISTKKLYITLGLAFVILLIISTVLAFAILKYHNQSINTTYASIIGAVVSELPQAESRVIEAVKAYDKDLADQGKQIMDRYGFDGDTVLQTSISQSLLKLLLPTMLGFTTLVFIILTLVSSVYVLGQRGQIRDLTKYLRRVNQGDYSLDIRDNREGILSILKNEIYKTTTMLKEQAEIYKLDKVQLANTLSDISHQLKTPLTSMFVMTDLLSQDNLPKDKRQEFTKRIQHQLERIQWLVISLLKLSKLDAGSVVLKKEKIVVKGLIDKALEPLMIPIEIKNQSLYVTGSNDACYMGDFNWSVEMVGNVIKNCVEHTPEGGSINIDYSENSLYTQITISDTGFGIHRDDLPYIFNRFYKGKNSSEDSVGIGLAISKSTIEKQGGNITVESEKDRGTKFTLRLYKTII